MARPRTKQRSRPDTSVRPIAVTPVWPLLVIVAAGLLAYANSLSGPFVFDDELSILQNVSIRRLSNLAGVFSPERELPVAGRPLVNLSFAFNYAVGGLNVTGYHLVNIAWHLVCGLLVFGVVRRTLELPRVAARLGATSGTSSGTPSAFAALAAAVLWTVHPLNTEAVNYVTQRTELMMAAFYLLTVYAAIRAATSSGDAWTVTAAVASAAGMACKESMATVPLMVVVYDRVFLFDSFANALRARWRLYGGLAASWLVLALVLWSGPRVHSAGFSSGVGVWTYLLNQTVMISTYVAHAFWPSALVFNYGWPADLALADVLPYAAFVALLLALTVVAFVRAPMWAFLGAWFFVTLAPTSSIVPIATEVGANRRMYLPLVAIAALAALALSRVERRWSRREAAVVLSACAVVLGTLTVLRNRDYASSLLLATADVERHPTSLAHHALGVELIKVGRKDDGIAQLRQALPDATRAYYALGVELFKQGRMEEAIAELRTFVEREPLLLEAVAARQLLGQAYAARERWPEAVEQYRLVLTMNPSADQRLTTEIALGQAFQRQEQYGEAVLHYTEYLKLRPNDAPVLTSLGISLMGAGRAAEALSAFRKAVDANPNDGGSRRNLANALLDNRDAAGALTHAERAVALRPNDPGALDVFGRALAIQGRLAESRAAFERALQIAPNDTEVRAHMAALERLALSGR